ncbi:MAG TPA: CocE/NonD family hydrolase [Thermoleophilaceae bacterium]|nr:CocE/NonD family hydrolase [Thermoleophilaceae bacterium]
MSIASEAAGRAMGLPRPLSRDVVVQRDLEVPMPDGALLLADRYAPKPDVPSPTVLVRSPYGRRGPVGLLFGRLLAERGLQAVVQSVRGTFGSGGDFDPFDERDDGLATLEWVGRQPWHEGGIGMTGPSYLGLTQWAVARGAGDALAAMAPSVTASNFHGQAMGSGAISLETGLSWVTMMAVQERRGAPLHMLRRLRQLPGVIDELPVGGLDALAAGAEVPFYADWLAHTTADDPYWTARDHSADVADVTAPVQLVGGWSDIFLPWMLEDFVALQDAGRSPQLMVGPWTHTAPELARVSAREGIAWLRAHLLGDRRMLDPAPVRVWVGGAREWRSMDTWPPPSQPRALHARAGGRLTEDEPEADEAPDRYRYDPAHPTPSVGGPTLLARDPVTDNTGLEARDDVLVFTTDPLEHDLEVIGPVSAVVHVRADAEHFDVFARVCDVLPSGTSLNVCDVLARVEPGRFDPDADGVHEVLLDLWPTARRFKAGHRIRLQVSSGAHPRYARNLGTGEELATAQRMRAVDVTVLHDAAHPTAVTLPVTA